jgi:pimeloyl-ACP methyl ester carboxylesterase
MTHRLVTRRIIAASLAICVAGAGACSSSGETAAAPPTTAVPGAGPDGAAPAAVSATDGLPAGFETRQVRVDGGELRVVTVGTGPVVLLLHGFPEDASAWRGVLPALAQRHKVVAPDLPGLGGSKVEREDYSLETLAGMIDRLMAALWGMPAGKTFNTTRTEPLDVPIAVVGGQAVFGTITDGMAADLRSWGVRRVDAHVIADAGHYVADEQPGALAALTIEKAG